MDKSKPPPFLGKERGNTDRNLSNERERTDRHMAEARSKVEQRTDAAVLKGRQEANQVRTETRHETDVSRAAVPSMNGEQQRMDRRLFEERQESDRAVGEERTRSDQALSLERDVKQGLIESLLAQERELTDASLVEERGRTDSEVNRVTRLFSSELSSHLKTKAELTSREEIMAIVSHDLRNPIGAIYSCAEMLLADAPEGLGGDSRHWIEFIQRNAGQALRLINDILDIERIAEGKLSFCFAQYNISDLLKEAAERFSHAASAQKIQLSVRSPTEVGTAVVDRDRMMQVLSNLVGNALKFTPAGGSVVLRAFPENNQILFSVCDTGPGIPEQEKERIFGRFAQISQGDRKGLGLGLYISRMLVEAHQGRLWVQSEPGKGSDFRFLIPKSGPDLSFKIH